MYVFLQNIVYFGTTNLAKNEGILGSLTSELSYSMMLIKTCQHGSST